MITDKKISIKAIIAKVYRDLKLTEEEEFDDMIEHAAEALDFIGVYPQYDHISTTINVTNYKAELPCNYLSLEAIAYDGLPLRPSTSQVDIKKKEYPYLTPTSYNQEKFMNVNYVGGIYNLPDGNSFKIENGWFKTSFKEGDVQIVYTGLPIDEEGFPLIPNDVSFKEALYWYIVMKWSFAKLRTNDISSEYYSEAKRQWHWYCNQAGAQAMMPDLATLENIKRVYLSLRVRPDMYDNFFKDLNKNY